MCRELLMPYGLFGHCIAMLAAIDVLRLCRVCRTSADYIREMKPEVNLLVGRQSFARWGADAVRELSGWMSVVGMSLGDWGPNERLVGDSVVLDDTVRGTLRELVPEFSEMTTVAGVELCSKLEVLRVLCSWRLSDLSCLLYTSPSPRD